MAKDKEATVEVPLSLLEEMKQRLAALEHKTRIQDEQLNASKAIILDPAYEAWKKDVGRPAAERTQDIADRLYPNGEPFRVKIDSSKPDGKPGPNVSEHPEIVIRANSPEEAEGRYRKLCGIRGIDSEYRFDVQPANGELLTAAV